MSTNYEGFLEAKMKTCEPSGFEPGELSGLLFDFQKDVVRWAIRRGRAAIFADCGLGKTFMQLEWARLVSEHENRPVLIMAPLAVSQQTIGEASKFGIVAKYSSDGTHDAQITVTNYERLHNFNPDEFAGVVLDESSILKSYDGKTRTAIIEAFKATPYRLACTATPAPNDFMELGNHSEFLGIMTRAEMLAMYFVHDGGETQKWRLKGHARSEFWKWVCSWAAMIRKPSDLGYNDEGFDLPDLDMRSHVVDSGSKPRDGMLFLTQAETLQERIAERRRTVDTRAAKVADIVNASPDESWIVWCNLNAEADAARRLIPGAVEVRGSDKPEKKEQTLADFSAGKIRVLVTKPSIAGFGMNWQHCARVAFLGLSDSYEQFYQAIRRTWRFGQGRKVQCNIVTADTEGAVLENIQRKEADSKQMAEEMAQWTAHHVQQNIKGTERNEMTYATETTTGDDWTLHLGDCVEGVSGLDTESIDYTIFSPPFASLYTYSNSIRDMGNSASNDEFAQHFEFLVGELLRVTKPGRLVSFHCMNLPTSKSRDGVIGLRDFRGELIRMFIDAGWIYHSEVVIWKDPVTAMQRTKALGLLYKQLKKDSAMSRQGIPDYLVTMRKPGDNPDRVTKDPEDFPVSMWQNYASPVWMDINPSRTLQYRSAREHDDEKHICPLQLDVIERAIQLWTNEGDLVLSPFAGIGSEGHVSLEHGRRFVGFELKGSYYAQACRNLEAASRATAKQMRLIG